MYHYDIAIYGYTAALTITAATNGLECPVRSTCQTGRDSIATWIRACRPTAVWYVYVCVRWLGQLLDVRLAATPSDHNVRHVHVCYSTTSCASVRAGDRDQVSVQSALSAQRRREKTFLRSANTGVHVINDRRSTLPRTNPLQIVTPSLFRYRIGQNPTGNFLKTGTKPILLTLTDPRTAGKKGVMTGVFCPGRGGGLVQGG